MAVYSKLITTENGRTLIARMLSGGEKVVFTKVCSSDREYGLEELGNLEELAEIRQTSSVSKVSRTNDISVKVEAVFTNTELTEGYYMKTVALYARGGEGEEGFICSSGRNIRQLLYAGLWRHYSIRGLYSAGNYGKQYGKCDA